MSEQMTKQCNRCDDEAAGRFVKYCLPCRKEVMRENGRKQGRRNARLGKGYIYVAPTKSAPDEDDSTDR